MITLAWLISFNACSKLIRRNLLIPVDSLIRFVTRLEIIYSIKSMILNIKNDTIESIKNIISKREIYISNFPEYLTNKLN
jgi:hypothetical protein